MRNLLLLVIFWGSFHFNLIAQPVPYLNAGRGNVKNIILLIGDGMGISQITAGMTANKGKLNLEQMKYIGLSKTQSSSNYITDSGAGGTAIATGHKTYDAAIGVDKDSVPCMSILEYAEQNNKSTGLVVTSQVTHATPASFVAHVLNRYLMEDIALDLMKSGVDVFIGGGRKYFNQRTDKRDLIIEMEKQGYQLIDTISNLNIPNTSGKLAGLLYLDEPPRYTQGRGNMLPDAAEIALQILSQNPEGFFLMIEGSQIDWGGHDNDTQYIVDEMLDFDRAVGVALDFAKKNRQTLVIVTADHETGGMTLNAGNKELGEVEAMFTTSHHTGVMVPVFAYGAGASEFVGIYENTEIFYKMMHAFGFEVLKK